MYTLNYKLYCHYCGYVESNSSSIGDGRWSRHTLRLSNYVHMKCRYCGFSDWTIEMDVKEYDVQAGTN